MKEPANFEAFWWCWERRSALKRFRPDFAHLAATFEAVGAFGERQRLIAAGWIEPKPVIPPPPLHVLARPRARVRDRAEHPGDTSMQTIFAHTSVALRDAILAVKIPFVEVHLSNVHAREAFRHHSYFSDVAIGVICGLGAQGYDFALQYAVNYLNNR